MSQPIPKNDVDGDALLHRFHDGEVDDAERARVEEQLAEDPQARDKLAALDELGGLLRARFGAADAPDVWPTVEKKIAESKVVPLSRRLRRTAPVWMSTLAVAAAALAAFLVFPTGTHPSNDCQVDELEVSGASATILKVPDDHHGGSTTVLWLEE